MNFTIDRDSHEQFKFSTRQLSLDTTNPLQPRFLTDDLETFLLLGHSQCSPNRQGAKNRPVVVRSLAATAPGHHEYLDPPDQGQGEGR